MTVSWRTLAHAFSLVLSHRPWCRQETNSYWVKTQLLWLPSHCVQNTLSCQGHCGNSYSQVPDLSIAHWASDSMLEQSPGEQLRNCPCRRQRVGTGEITCVFPSLLCWAPFRLLLQRGDPSGIRKPKKGSRMPFSPRNARPPRGAFPFYDPQLSFNLGNRWHSFASWSIINQEFNLTLPFKPLLWNDCFLLLLISFICPTNVMKEEVCYRHHRSGMKLIRRWCFLPRTQILVGNTQI